MTKLEEIVDRAFPCTCVAHMEMIDWEHLNGCESLNRDACRRAVREALMEAANRADTAYSRGKMTPGQPPWTHCHEIGDDLHALAATLEDKS